MGYGGIDVDDLNEARAERDALRAQLAEVTRERDALGESLTTLVYWHDHGGIDASWWTDARELLSAHAKASGVSREPKQATEQGPSRVLLSGLRRQAPKAMRVPKREQGARREEDHPPGDEPMTDSKFCEHGVNVGLENPPVFCGQCPPDTITKLRADLASVRLDYANECDRARRAEARHERDKDELRADLARVTDERDEAMAALEGVSNALGGLELYELSETAGHVETVVADRDEALAELARVTDERDEARAKVAGLTLNPDAVARAKGACSYFAALDLMTDHGRAKHRETVEELTRYAEALGGAVVTRKRRTPSRSTKHMPTVPFVIGPPDDARIVAIVREWGGRRAMNQKLLLPKACPWCKGIPYVEHDTGMWRVVCLVEACPVNPCTVQTEDRDEIVARWNRRNNNAKEGE